MIETIFRKIYVIQNGLRQGSLSISFPKYFLWLLPSIQQKRILLNGANTPVSSKIYQKVGAFSY